MVLVCSPSALIPKPISPRGLHAPGVSPLGLLGSLRPCRKPKACSRLESLRASRPLIALPRKAAAISERRGRHSKNAQSVPEAGRLWSNIMNKLDTDSDMYRIVGCAFAVYNHLKPGYLESVYEKALEKELTAEGFSVRRQVKLPVYYKGELLDAPFVADMIVNDAVLVELKAVSNLAKIHERQVESYLKSTGMESGLLVNFGNLRRLEWRVISL